MPVYPSNTGVPNPDAGPNVQTVFAPATAVLDGVRGHVPGPTIGIDGTYFLAADATWKKGTASVSLVPVITFTGSAAGGTGQTFTSIYFNGSYYTKAEDIELFYYDGTLGGVKNPLFGAPSGIDFTLNTATSSITVLASLPSSTSLFINSKVITGTAPTDTYYILTELGDILNAENSDRLRKEQNS